MASYAYEDIPQLEHLLANAVVLAAVPLSFECGECLPRVLADELKSWISLAESLPSFCSFTSDPAETDEDKASWIAVSA